jgi:Flp pilus assembly protein TadD
MEKPMPLSHLARPLAALASLAAAGLLTACAGLPATPAAVEATADLVEIPSSRGLSLAETGVVALDEDMRGFLARAVAADGEGRRLRQLVGAVVESPDFRVDYADDTRSARETFHALRGNCLSFTNLFIAFARPLGLNASYQEVDVPPTWAAADDAFVLSRHINVLVTTETGTEHVVDFNMADFRAAYPRRAISDERAAAHYYSNLGVERLQAGDAPGAFELFRRALAMDRTLPQAWVNLGAWYRRQGDAARAEASYLEALRVDPNESAAMSNLAILHAREGRADLARWYQRRIASYRAQNPYYHYELAKAAYLKGDYVRAARESRAALHRSDVDPAFYSLLGMSYRELGRPEAAREAFARAVELASDEDLRSAVRRKLELLGAPTAGL